MIFVITIPTIAAQIVETQTGKIIFVGLAEPRELLIAIIVVGLVCTVFTGVTWCLIAFVSWLFGVTIIPFYWIWIFAFILMLIGLFLEYNLVIGRKKFICVLVRFTTHLLSDIIFRSLK